MKNPLKVLMIAFFSFCIAGSFVSCGNKNPTHITLWYGLASTDSPPPPSDWKLYDLVRENLGIELELVAMPFEASDRVKMIENSLQYGSLPDLFMVNHDELVSLVKRNEVACVESMFELMPIRASQMYDENSKSFSTVNGNIYGLSHPGMTKKNEGILIRKDWLDNLKLQVPVTLEEYLDVMRKFTFNDPDGNGIDDTYGFGAFIEIFSTEEGLGRRFAPFFGAFGVAGTFNMTVENGGLNIRKPEYYDALCFVKKMIDEKVIDPKWFEYNKNEFRDAWRSGRFGIMREQNAAYGLESGYKKFDENFPDGEWIVINPPKGPNGLQSVGSYTQSYRTFAVSKKAESLGKLPVIAKLLEWMSTDGYYLIAYGEENINFNFDAWGNITTKRLPNPEFAYTKKIIMPYLQLRNLVLYGSDSELISRYPTWTTKNGKKISALATLRDMQIRPWTATIGAEQFPPPSSELKSFYEEGILDFVVGRKMLTKSSWNDWLKEFDNMGGLKWEKDCLHYAMENNLLKN